MQHNAPIGERLLERGLIDAAQLEKALEAQTKSGGPLGELLVQMGLLEEDALNAVLSDQLEIPVVNLKHTPIDPEAGILIPEDYARRHLVIPIMHDNGHLQVAMADPRDLALLNDLSFITGRRIKPYLATRSDILHSLARIHGVKSRIEKAADTFQQARPELKIAPVAGPTDLASITAESPVVEIVNLLITQGLRDRASDIHLEPQEGRLRVRFRVDGVLQDIAHLPQSIAPAMASRVKVMADLNIVERHRGQDGQISLNIEGRNLDIRVSTGSTIWGEKVVLRLLDRSRSLIKLEKLGFAPAAYRSFSRLLHYPFGMIIVSGPTGSGKTTTLYAALNELDSREKNIMTIEDPVEYTFENINQSQINKLADLTFANGLRIILRQDPDVILVGEIRDQETAEIAVHSALTGHLVLSSLHSTDAVGAVHRLIDMGIEGFLIASSVTGVVAQRLVRRICPGCKVESEPTLEEITFGQTLGQAVPDTLYRGAGCIHCNQTGYFDRTGVFEVLVVDDEIKKLVLGRARNSEIQAVAIEQGMVPMRQSAWDLAIHGETTVSEILRSVYTI